MAEDTGYAYSRAWFDFAFENPTSINTNHAALLFFIIEHRNRLGWKEKFGLPTTMAMEALGVKSYNTYIKTLRDLVEWGFVKMVEQSKNQYSANIVALSKNNKAHTKALDKATLKHLTKHLPKQRESTYQSNSSIDKPLTINHEPITIQPSADLVFKSDLFFEKWGEWKEYLATEKKAKIKTAKQETRQCKNLYKLARGNETTAIEILEQSMAKGWIGLFELKNGNDNRNHTTEKIGRNTRQQLADFIDGASH